MEIARVQKPAPFFDVEALLPNGEFGKVSLNDFKGKYLVLFFYPMDFTFVCPTEICAFSDRIAEFNSRNCNVVAASTDSVFTHLAWTQQSRKFGGLGPMSIPVLSDMTHSLSKSYGVLLEHAGVALRGLFIIDDKGIVRQITMNDLPVGRNVDEVLRLIDAFQFTDEYGEVCPANWNKGDKTMKPTPGGSKEYFEAGMTEKSRKRKREGDDVEGMPVKR
eukprot:TRINITY_DN1872_c1_g3_i1.p1 TRINITY_DN1872_c1_g3~~TRINITY_DN1872_c1_g3_i1.p1  ORF type:complete len:219 (+),score=42.47 TRINITY_DN1872_c1_g3_i1:138-794(+)